MADQAGRGTARRADRPRRLSPWPADGTPATGRAFNRRWRDTRKIVPAALLLARDIAEIVQCIAKVLDLYGGKLRARFGPRSIDRGCIRRICFDGRVGRSNKTYVFCTDARIAGPTELIQRTTYGSGSCRRGCTRDCVDARAEHVVRG
jgi:hypothetical protein